MRARFLLRLGTLLLLSAFSDPEALQGAELAAPAPALIPAAPPELPLSSIRVPLRIPLHEWRRSLDGAVEARVDSGSEYQSYEDDLALRWWLETEPLELGGEFDQMELRRRLYYGLDLRGDFGRARCPEEGRGIAADADLRVRVGWNDDWTAGMRVTQLPVRYEFRCKPRPPGVNFNRFFATRIQEHLVDPVLRALATGATPGAAERIELVWSQLQRPVELGARGAWLRFDPQEILVEPLGWSHGALEAEALVRVRARFLSGPLPELSYRVLPAPRVRLADRSLAVAFDCELPVERVTSTLEEELLGATLATADAEIQIERIAVATGGDRIVVTLSVRGALRGDLHLEGRLALEEDRSVRVRDLAYSKATMSELFELSPSALRLELDAWRTRLIDVLVLDAAPVITDRLRRIGRGLNTELGDGVALSGGAMQLDVLGFFQRDSDLVLRLAATGHAAVGPNAR